MNASAPAAAGLDQYYVPPLLLAGGLGNLLALFVFLRSSLRTLCSTQYLAALAVTDTIFLLLLLLPWLDGMQLCGLFHADGVCQAVVYLSYVACSCNAWLVTIFTVERFVAVEFPFIGRRCVWKAKHSRWMVLFAVVTAFVGNIPVIMLAVPSERDCNIDISNIWSGAIFNLADTVLNFSVPMIIIIVLNARIMFGVYRFPEREETPLETVHYGRRRVELTVRGRRPSLAQSRITRMLLIVSSTYVFLNLPNYVMRLFAYANENSEILNTVEWSLAQQLSQMAFNMNFGINFLLYCISGSNFRHELYQAVPFLRPRTNRNELRQRVSNPTVTMPTYNTTMRVRSSDQEYLRRWVFDNTRHRRQPPSNVPVPEEVELRPLPARRPPVEPPCPPNLDLPDLQPQFVCRKHRRQQLLRPQQIQRQLHYWRFQDLQQYKLHQPDLHQPDQQEPNLHQPDLRQPDMHQPDQPNVHQPDVHLPDVHLPDVHQEDLYQADVHQQVLHQLKVHLPDVHQEDLYQADLDQQVLYQVDVHQQVLHQVDVHQPDVHQEDLNQADVHQQVLHLVEVHQVDVHRPDHTKDNLHQPDVHQPDVHQLDLHQPNQTKDSVNQADAHQPEQNEDGRRQPDLHQTGLNPDDLEMTDLHQPDLKPDNLHQPDLQQTNLKPGDMHQPNVTQPGMNPGDLHQAGLHQPDLNPYSLHQPDHNPDDLHQVDLNPGDLQQPDLNPGVLHQPNEHIADLLPAPSGF